MLAYDTAMGEFRVHYAGFFDPGFGLPESGGADGSGGTRAVLEVRSHEVPFVLEDGQRVGRLVFERLIAPPDRLYGAGIGSSYQRQGLALSKHFRLD
jgi:dCTP deaminase